MVKIRNECRVALWMDAAKQDINWKKMTQNYMTGCSCLSFVFRIVPISRILRHTGNGWPHKHITLPMSTLTTKLCFMLRISIAVWLTFRSFLIFKRCRTTKWNGTTWTNPYNEKIPRIVSTATERHTQNHMQSLCQITSVKYVKWIWVREPFLFPDISLRIFCSLQRSIADKRI